MHTNEEIKWFIDMYISCDVSLLQTHYKMHNNINTHVHVKKKNHVVYRFHYPLPPMPETKNLKPLQNKWELSIFTTIPLYKRRNFIIFFNDISFF
jgi:hypothetical protein